jgi:hypothetical protein
MGTEAPDSATGVVSCPPRAPRRLGLAPNGSLSFDNGLAVSHSNGEARRRYGREPAGWMR